MNWGGGCIRSPKIVTGMQRLVIWGGLRQEAYAAFNGGLWAMSITREALYIKAAAQTGRGAKPPLQWMDS